jgi:hypothetical protein
LLLAFPFCFLLYHAFPFSVSKFKTLGTPIRFACPLLPPPRVRHSTTWSDNTCLPFILFSLNSSITTVTTHHTSANDPTGRKPYPMHAPTHHHVLTGWIHQHIDFMSPFCGIHSFNIDNLIYSSLHLRSRLSYPSTLSMNSTGSTRHF